MTNDYIRREDAVDELQVKVFHNLTDEYYGTMQVLTELPAADVVPVVHGRWIDADFCGQYECSECGNNAVDLYNYCPFCGAKMNAQG